MLGAACKPPLNFYLSILARVWKIQPQTRFPQNRPDLWGSNKTPLDVPLTLILHSVHMQVLLPKAQSNLRPSKPWFLRNCIPLQAHGLCSNWTFSVPACHIYPSLYIWTCNGIYSHEGNRRHKQGTLVCPWRPSPGHTKAGAGRAVWGCWEHHCLCRLCSPSMFWKISEENYMLVNVTGTAQCSAPLQQKGRCMRRMETTSMSRAGLSCSSELSQVKLWCYGLR